MIDYFHIPPEALIDVQITKKQFGEKVVLSGLEKRALREDVQRITMKALLQTRTIGVASYKDEEYDYTQIIFAEVSIRNQSKAAIIAAMIQKAFPAPLFLIVNYEDYYCVNWCVKRINQLDNSKRVIEDEQTTRFFDINGEEELVNHWLQSLNLEKASYSTLKDLYEYMASKLLMLKVSDEAGNFIQADTNTLVDYSAILHLLQENRKEQQSIIGEIKAETQFNKTIKLNSNLRELQDKERNLQKRLIKE